MIDGGTYAKPGAGTPGFARLLWSAVASFPYRNRLAGATNCVSILPVADDSSAGFAPSLWGGGQRLIHAIARRRFGCSKSVPVSRTRKRDSWATYALQPS
jgi:hypothetical protein